MLKKLRYVFGLANHYPFHGLKGKWFLLQQIFLYFFPKYSFPRMSIVPFVKNAYKLASYEEFRVRYYVSRIGFEELWASRQRNSKESIESFYGEHDKDIWRQAYLSRRDYIYKKKILWAYHIISQSGCGKNEPLLDYGCGAGAVMHYLSTKGYSAIHVADIPSATLDFIRKEFSDVFQHIFTIDGSENLQKEQYCCIFVLDCLEHTCEPLAITKRLLNALKPNGVIMITFPKETDFVGTHIREAQEERDAVFHILRQCCNELIPERVYRKK